MYYDLHDKFTAINACDCLADHFSLITPRTGWESDNVYDLYKISGEGAADCTPTTTDQWSWPNDKTLIFHIYCLYETP